MIDDSVFDSMHKWNTYVSSPPPKKNLQ